MNAAAAYGAPPERPSVSPRSRVRNRAYVPLPPTLRRGLVAAPVVTAGTTPAGTERRFRTTLRNSPDDGAQVRR